MTGRQVIRRLRVPDHIAVAVVRGDPAPPLTLERFDALPRKDQFDIAVDRGVWQADWLAELRRQLRAAEAG